MGARAAAALLAVGAASIAVSAAGSRTPTAELTVQLVPGAISPGQRALAAVTFVNRSSVTLKNVVVTLTFPSVLSVLKTPGCIPFQGSTHRVSCPFGEVQSGKTTRTFVNARVASRIDKPEKVRVVFALRVGLGTPAPILTGASAQVLASSDAANRGSCLTRPQTLVATLGDQVTALLSPPAADPGLKLPCTPLAVGVEARTPGTEFKTGFASVDLPKLTHPTIVKLTFANETLPDEALIENLPPGKKASMDNPNPLWRVDLKDPTKKYVVPKCRPGPTFPPGWRSCIVHVIASDPLGDADQGTITLLVQGAGFGDPRYVG